MEDASILLNKRYEKFLPFGPAYVSTFGRCQIYQAPHGVIAEKNGGTIFSQKSGQKITIATGSSCEEIALQTEGAVSSLSEHAGKRTESVLYRTVLAWSNFFDECILKSLDTSRSNKLPWTNLLGILKETDANDTEPRMALIVRIAERLNKQLPLIVQAARRILVRERTMVPAPRVAETDTACLRWYVRQPGTTSAQKAAANHHRLLAVTRRESRDTLENMVLKDFLKRSGTECRRYLNFDCTEQQRTHSVRGRYVNAFGHMCRMLACHPQLEQISPPPPAVRPNYVLQNDSRYKQIWEFYLRLLRREDAEDRLWDWQARTWADIARMLVNVTLISLLENMDGTRHFEIKEILKSALSVLPEQRLGARVEPGCEPGPFLVIPNHSDNSGTILEIVHPSLAGKHHTTKTLGRLGGHLYLVFTSLDGKRQTVVVIWAVHTAGGSPETRPAWPDIANSASRALNRHRVLLEERTSDFPSLHAFVLASDLEAEESEIYSATEGNVHLVRIPTDQKYWHSAVQYIALVVEEILELVI
ncbi:DUF2357 domain-containing protein [Desulfovibrio sp. Huiquan2017]|uniref:DUF2357 domain-containing protein n=1 Tax=Desulfovibrio sp. Huiquan2017 TaxID=2816861 RepID=UPI001A92FAF1|nr:DUF2357 domain-containing protein [Desulfovibrio sp. Huiquan2017]